MKNKLTWVTQTEIPRSPREFFAKKFDPILGKEIIVVSDDALSTVPKSNHHFRILQRIQRQEKPNITRMILEGFNLREKLANIFLMKSGSVHLFSLKDAPITLFVKKTMMAQLHQFVIFLAKKLNKNFTVLIKS